MRLDVLEYRVTWQMSSTTSFPDRRAAEMFGCRSLWHAAGRFVPEHAIYVAKELYARIQGVPAVDDVYSYRMVKKLFLSIIDIKLMLTFFQPNLISWIYIIHLLGHPLLYTLATNVVLLTDAAAAAPMVMRVAFMLLLFVADVTRNVD